MNLLLEGVCPLSGPDAIASVPAFRVLGLASEPDVHEPHPLRFVPYGAVDLLAPGHELDAGLGRVGRRGAPALLALALALLPALAVLRMTHLQWFVL